MAEEPIDLSHLHQAAQRVAMLPAEERLRHVRSDRWIGYSRATEALARLEALFTCPDKQRMPNLLLIGPTNNGKSMIVEKFRRMHPPVSHPDHEHIPVLAVQMPSEPSVIRFYVALLAAMGAPLRPRQRLAELDGPRSLHHLSRHSPHLPTNLRRRPVRAAHGLSQPAELEERPEGARAI